MTVKIASCPVMNQLYQITVAHQLDGIDVIERMIVFFDGELTTSVRVRCDLLLLRTSSFRIVVWVRMQIQAEDHVVGETQLRTVGYI